MNTKTIRILQGGHLHDGRELLAGETHTIEAWLADWLIQRGVAEAPQPDRSPAAETL